MGTLRAPWAGSTRRTQLQQLRHGDAQGKQCWALAGSVGQAHALPRARGSLGASPSLPAISLHQLLAFMFVQGLNSYRPLFLTTLRGVCGAI